MGVNTEIEFIKKKFINEKSYVVTESNYQYNDSTYDLEGQTPLTIFLDKEKAEKFALEQTHKCIAGENIYGYGFTEVEDILKNGKSIKDLEKLGIEIVDYELNIPATFTLEQTKQLLEVLDLVLFEVHEIDVVL